MKVKVETYKIVCDCCGETFHNDNDFTCYTDDLNGSMIREDALESDWREFDDKHYCPDCMYWDDDDYLCTKDGHKYDVETEEEILT